MGERAIQSETTVKLQMYEWLRESFGIPGNSFMLHFDLSAKLFCFKRCRKMQGQFNCCQNHSFRARNLKFWEFVGDIVECWHTQYVSRQSNIMDMIRTCKLRMYRKLTVFDPDLPPTPIW
eukprot:sb/3476141/